MIVIGLTGGTGAGKGTVCKIFSRYGINSIDTDQTARSVCLPNKPCLIELINYFGSSILNPDGSLNRPALADAAFSSKEKHRMLNTITHKHILAEVRLWLEEQKKSQKIAAIVDAPLLFESGFDKECDIIISVTAPTESRKQRIIERDSLSDFQAEQRMSKQHPDKFYTDKSHFVITNTGSLSDLNKQIDVIFNSLLKNGSV